MKINIYKTAVERRIKRCLVYPVFLIFLVNQAYSSGVPSLFSSGAFKKLKKEENKTKKNKTKTMSGYPKKRIFSRNNSLIGPSLSGEKGKSYLLSPYSKNPDIRRSIDHSYAKKKANVTKRGSLFTPPNKKRRDLKQLFSEPPPMKSPNNSIMAEKKVKISKDFNLDSFDKKRIQNQLKQSQIEKLSKLYVSAKTNPERTSEAKFKQNFIRFLKQHFKMRQNQADSYANSLYDDDQNHYYTEKEVINSIHHGLRIESNEEYSFVRWHATVVGGYQVGVVNNVQPVGQIGNDNLDDISKNINLSDPTIKTHFEKKKFKIAVPININASHWASLIIKRDNNNLEIEYMDPMDNSTKEIDQKVLESLEALRKNFMNEIGIENVAIRKVLPKEVQPGLCDCGPFISVYQTDQLLGSSKTSSIAERSFMKRMADYEQKIIGLSGIKPYKPDPFTKLFSESNRMLLLQKIDKNVKPNQISRLKKVKEKLQQNVSMKKKFLKEKEQLSTTKKGLEEVRHRKDELSFFMENNDSFDQRKMRLYISQREKEEEKERRRREKNIETESDKKNNEANIEAIKVMLIKNIQSMGNPLEVELQNVSVQDIKGFNQKEFFDDIQKRLKKEIEKDAAANLANFLQNLRIFHENRYKELIDEVDKIEKKERENNNNLPHREKSFFDRYKDAHMTLKRVEQQLEMAKERHKNMNNLRKNWIIFKLNKMLEEGLIEQSNLQTMVRNGIIAFANMNAERRADYTTEFLNVPGIRHQFQFVSRDYNIVGNSTEWNEELNNEMFIREFLRTGEIPFAETIAAEVKELEKIHNELSTNKISSLKKEHSKLERTHGNLQKKRKKGERTIKSLERELKLPSSYNFHRIGEEDLIKKIDETIAKKTSASDKTKGFSVRRVKIRNSANRSKKKQHPKPQGQGSSLYYYNLVRGSTILLPQDSEAGFISGLQNNTLAMSKRIHRFDLEKARLDQRLYRKEITEQEHHNELQKLKPSLEQEISAYLSKKNPSLSSSQIADYTKRLLEDDPDHQEGLTGGDIIKKVMSNFNTDDFDGGTDLNTTTGDPKLIWKKGGDSEKLTGFLTPAKYDDPNAIEKLLNTIMNNSQQESYEIHTALFIEDETEPEGGHWVYAKFSGRGNEMDAHLVNPYPQTEDEAREEEARVFKKMRSVLSQNVPGLKVSTSSDHNNADQYDNSRCGYYVQEYIARGLGKEPKRGEENIAVSGIKERLRDMAQGDMDVVGRSINSREFVGTGARAIDPGMYGTEEQFQKTLNNTAIDPKTRERVDRADRLAKEYEEALSTRDNKFSPEVIQEFSDHIRKGREILYLKNHHLNKFISYMNGFTPEDNYGISHSDANSDNFQNRLYSKDDVALSSPLSISVHAAGDIKEQIKGMGIDKYIEDRKPKKVLIPITIRNGHWVLLELSRDGESYEPIIYNPMDGTDYNEALSKMTQDLSKVISVHPIGANDDDIKSLGVQKDDHSCGFIVEEFMRDIVEGNGVNQDKDYQQIADATRLSRLMEDGDIRLDMGEFTYSHPRSLIYHPFERVMNESNKKTKEVHMEQIREDFMNLRASYTGNKSYFQQIENDNSIDDQGITKNERRMRLQKIFTDDELHTMFTGSSEEVQAVLQENEQLRNIKQSIGREGVNKSDKKERKEKYNSYKKYFQEVTDYLESNINDIKSYGSARGPLVITQLEGYAE